MESPDRLVSPTSPSCSHHCPAKLKCTLSDILQVPASLPANYPVLLRVPPARSCMSSTMATLGWRGRVHAEASRLLTGHASCGRRS
jgi:hypothetical protein